MPSFATEVKNELARDIVRAKCCQNAELAALLRMGASVTIGANMSLGLNFIKGYRPGTARGYCQP